MKRIVVFGSTGSIGRSTLSVIRRFPERFRVVGLSAHSQTGLLRQQAAEFKPEVVVLSGESHKSGLALPVNSGGKTEIFLGTEGLRKIAFWPGVDLAVLAIPGTESTMPAVWVLEAGRNLALASKEALVMAGEVLISKARSSGTVIIPLDSEHNAIFQIVSAFPGRRIKKIYLTASGGPFWKKKPKRKVSIREALAHPVWKMGKKVTVDSATMMNKALEVIGAHYLFGLPPEKIEVLIHPEVAVHGLVEFEDGFTIANLSVPDMRISIAFGLFWPERPPSSPVLRTLSLPEMGRLRFEKPSRRQFPALRLVYQVLEKAGSYPGVFSAANEEAVASFLSGLIEFEEIIPLVEKTLAKRKPFSASGPSEIIIEAEKTRSFVRSLISDDISQPAR